MTDASPAFVNGAKDDFAGTYDEIQNRLADSRLAMVMDLDGPTATNREHDFPFWETTPYFDLWIEGASIPMEPMFAKTFNVIVHHWAKGIEWHKNHRADDQTRRLLQSASRLAESAGNLQEQAFFDLLLASNVILPGSPTAPDGRAMHHANGVGSTDRFGVSGGNIITGSTVAATDDILTDYYAAIARFRNMQDTKGQPLWTPDVIDQGTVLVYGSDNEQLFEQAFLQKRGVATSASVATTNIIEDASRNVELWSTSRITDNDWFVFLKGAPIKSSFVLNRQAINFTSALEGMNNSDSLRRTGMEFVAWDLRQGFAINTAYSTVKVNN